jgi:putative Ca2+/H+ antiporter (TMEM165/GDT1 family)
MQSLLISTGVVAVSEIGDKTQLLALLLACRFRKPIPIIAGILVATLLNHGIAAVAGGWIAATVDPQILRWVLGLLFLGMAAWAVIPDKIDEERACRTVGGSAFLTTAVCFFLAEMGDKTQIATAALAAQFNAIFLVIIGTTVGMLIADVPAVLFGNAAGGRLDQRRVRYAAAVVFAALGGLALSGIKLF